MSPLGTLRAPGQRIARFSQRGLGLLLLGALSAASAGSCGGDSGRRLIPDGEAGAGGAPEPGASPAGDGGMREEAGGSSAESGAAGTTEAGGEAGSAGADLGSASDPPGCTVPAFTKLSAEAEGIPEAGLVLWLRADVGVGVDAQNGVCVWRDQSGQHHDVSQSDVAARPKAKATLNGKPALDVDPGQTLMRADVLGIAPTSGRSIVAVYALDTPATRFAIYQGLPGTNYDFIGLDDNTFQTVGNRYGCYITSQSYDGNIVTDSAAHIRVLRVDSMQPGLPVASNLHCRLDSLELALTYRCCDASKLIGDFSAADATLVPATGDAKIAEVLVYDRALNASALAQLEDTLSQRYGIEVGE